MRRLVLITCLGMLPAVANSEPTVQRVGVLTRLVFTDNLYLNRSGKEPDAILQVLPNITAGRTGNRASYRFYYGPSALIYGGDNSDLNRVAHTLHGDAAIKIVDEYLGLRISARANENLISPDGVSAGFDALGNPDAFTQTAGIAITPVIRFPVIRGDFARVQIEPGINFVYASDTESGARSGATTGSRSRAAVTSGDRFTKLNWSVVWAGEVFDTEDDASQQSTFLTIGYEVDRRWSVVGLLGYDSADYVTTKDTAGPRWRITPTWTPSANTNVSVGYGERYFGNDWYLRLSHSHKKSRIVLEYETTVTDARAQVLANDVVTFENAFGDSLSDPFDVQDLSGTATNPAFRDGVIIIDRLRGTYGYRLGRTTLTMSGWRDSRDYQASDSVYLDSYVNGVLSRALTPRATGSIIVNLWRHEEDDTNPTDYDQLRASLQWSYKLNSSTTTSVRYSYLERMSEIDSQSFDENRLSLTFNWAL